MGVAYKPGVSDLRESPALDVMAVLLQKGANVSYHDPFAPSIAVNDWTQGVPLNSIPYGREAVTAADCVVILTDHKTFDYAELLSAAELVVDTRGAIRTAAQHLYKLGSPNPP